MKKLIVLIGMVVSGSLFSQTITHITLEEYGKPIYMSPKAGSCGSPDGPMNSIGGPPASYAWLQANGYCNPASYGTNPTVCWTFTPTSSSVTINSGYSTTGCANIGFGPFTLYNNSCTNIGSGLSFTGLTPGLQYTWCMTGSAWGGGPGCIGFTDFCPYFTNNTVLPIILDYFKGESIEDYNYLSWATWSETNNSYFTLEKSNDAKNWEVIDTQSGAGTSNEHNLYNYLDYEVTVGAIYYRLSQTDFDGLTEYFKIITLISKPLQTEKPKAYDTIGRVIEHPDSYIGIIIYKYSNGFWYKVTRLK